MQIIKNKRIRRLVSLILAILLFAYVGYQVYIISKKDIETEIATFGMVPETIPTTGFAVRNEQPISESYSGVLDYTVADGSRVSKGGRVADIYQTERDTALKGRVKRLESEIDMLKALAYSEEHYISNPELLSGQIYAALGGIYQAINAGDFSELSVKRDEFQMALNRKNIITGDESKEEYIERIGELEAEMDEIRSTAGESIDYVEAPTAGYFISSVDGYEEVFDFSKISKVTASEIKEAINNEEKPVIPDNTIGKICTEFNWYLLCVLTNDDFLRLENVDNVKIEIPFATPEKVPAKIVAKNRDKETDEVAVVFKCSNMDSDIAKVRNEPIKIEVKTYSGVLVNEKSIFFEDVEREYVQEDGTRKAVTYENVKGVYVKKGSKMEFVQIFTERTINGYAICKTELSDEQRELLVTDNTIRLYDEVIKGGSDLYDGKLIY